MYKITFAALSVLFLSMTALATPQSNQVDVEAIPTLWTPRLAVEFALANNPDSQIAAQRIEAATAAISLAEATYMPTVGVHSSYGQTDNPMYSFGNILNQGAYNNSIDFNNPGRTDNLNLTFDVNYRLYNGGRDRAAIDVAENNKKSTANNSITVRNNLAFEVVKTFQSIIQAGDIMIAQDSSLKAIEASLAVAEARYEAGAILREDLLNLEVQKARASENLIQSRHHRSILERVFFNLLGIRKSPVALTYENSLQDIPVNIDFGVRSELHGLDNRIAAAEAERVRAEGRQLPTVDGFASYQYDQGYVLDEEGDSWMAGVRLNYTIYDGRQTESRVAMAKSKISQLRKKRIQLELTLNLEVEQAKHDFKEAQERQVVTQKMVDVAEESARLSRIRFKEGVVLASNLIDVERRLTDAQVRFSVANAMYKTAIAKMRRAAGLPQFQ